MSVQKRNWTDKKGKRHTAWVVRWEEGDKHPQRTFKLKADAETFDAEIKRRQRLGTIADLDAGTQTLDRFVVDTWTPTYAAQLAPKTRAVYAVLYDRHISPELGSLQLRQLNPENIRRWQADRLKDGAGPAAIHKSITLLGNILQRAVEGGHIQANPARAVRKARVPKNGEVRPLAPRTVEAMRSELLNPAPVQVAASDTGKRRRRAYTATVPGSAHTRQRDSVIISILAYAGLRPEEMLALRWSDIRERTILIERAVADGQLVPTKNHKTRTVRLLSPLAADLRQFRVASGRPAADNLIFPADDGEAWPESAWQSWRSHQFTRALKAAGLSRARPYDLRHSFASLLLHEGRNVIYVARQLGHGARLTLDTYGHVIEELEEAPQTDAEAAITQARSASVAHQLRKAAS